MTLHGKWDGPPDLMVQALQAADWVVGCSSATLNWGCRMVPAITAYSSVIYNGLAPPSSSPTMLPIDEPHLLYLSRLSPEKGADLALSAFAALVQRFPKARSRGKRKKAEHKKDVIGKPEFVEVAPSPISKELKRHWSYFIRKV